MCSMVWARGVNTLVLANQISNICFARGAVHVMSRPCMQKLTFSHLKCLNRRWKSGVFLKAGSSEDGGDGCKNNKLLGVIKEVPPTRGRGTGYEKNFKILVIGRSSKIKSLICREAPLLHHAQAGTLVDVRNDASHKGSRSTEHRPLEIHLRMDQLLKDSQASVENAINLQEGEDFEYIEETKDCKQEKIELMGALPPGALDWKPQRMDFKKLGFCYSDLSKSKLTGLVVITAVAGYAMAPGPLDPITLILCSLGTGFTSSAANTINQFFEVPYDSQMDRTKNRVLVRGLVSPLHAICFAVACSTAGICFLYFGANGIAASLGALNLFLYTSVYTPMKRFSIVNTWVGSVVGAIPPLIGWASCTGGLEAGAWIMAGILYAWQFPHFNALSWNLRPDYSRAGYRMMAVTNPGLCRRVALRYSVAMIGICTLAPMLDLTTWTFAADSLPLNGYLTYLAWRFYQDEDSKSSRKLFMFTLFHLPALMMLMIISKKSYSKERKLETEEISSSTCDKSEAKAQVSVGIHS